MLNIHCWKQFVFNKSFIIDVNISGFKQILQMQQLQQKLKTIEEKQSNGKGNFSFYSYYRK